MTSSPPSTPLEHPHAALERLLIQALVLFCVAIAVYIPAMTADYIYDDDYLLTQNQLIQQGGSFTNAESWQGLKTIWFPAGRQDVVDYSPLSTTTLWIEWRLWGRDNEPGTPPPLRGIGAPGYHVTNILLHAGCALLLWAALARMGMQGAWFAALLWAVHPVCVESVAWISERRNTMSMLMLMLTMYVWFHFQETRRWRYYALALVLFALALLAKSTVVMLPFFLLLWIWWRRRMKEQDLLEAAPFFALSLAFGLITVFYQYQRGIAEETLPVDGILGRTMSACFALGFYAWKALFPFNLIFNYPEWHKSVPKVLQVLPIIPFIALFALAWQTRKTWGRHVILGVGFFALMILPALGIMTMAYMRITLVADHFEYMPMAGLIALVVAGAVHWRAGLKKKQSADYATAAACCIAILFCGLTWVRATVFGHSESLWRDTLAKNDDSWQAHEHLGALIYEAWQKNTPLDSMPDRSKMLDVVLEHFHRGVILRDWLAETHNNYGNLLRLKGHLDEGLSENRRAVELTGNNPTWQVNYASALLMAGRADEAVDEYKKAAKMNPNNLDIYYYLGLAEEKAGRLDDAISRFQEILKVAPDSQLIQQALARVLQTKAASGRKN